MPPTLSVRPSGLIVKEPTRALMSNVDSSNYWHFRMPVSRRRATQRRKQSPTDPGNQCQHTDGVGKMLQVVTFAMQIET